MEWDWNLTFVQESEKNSCSNILCPVASVLRPGAPFAVKQQDVCMQGQGVGRGPTLQARLRGRGRIVKDLEAVNEFF